MNVLHERCPHSLFIRAAGSLGWAFPASLGAKCAAPDRPVVCFTGDGGFWYHLTELETAIRCGIKTVTVVNNNYGFGQCQPDIDIAYGDNPGNIDELCKFNRFNLLTEEVRYGRYNSRENESGGPS